MGLRSKASGLLIAGVFFASCQLHAAALATPQGLQSDGSSGSLMLRWKSVAGAGLYRVAVFDAPEKDGKRPLLAAVWVKGCQYIYGETVTVPKAGKFPSTKPLPLPSGHRLRAMVAAALGDGSDKGEWAGLDVDPLDAPMAAPISMSATATASPTATSTSTPGSHLKDAELDVKGGEEFKQTPDAAVLDIDDAPASGASAGNAISSSANSSANSNTATATTDSKGNTPGAAQALAAEGSTPLGEAKGLLSAGRFELAEAAYRALLEKDPNNADNWEGLGDSFAGRKMKLEAKESYEKALELNKSKTHLRAWIEKNVRR